MGERLEPAQWYASLPTFLSSASMLITDRAGSAVLAVKPNYRSWWNLPGGIMEGDEPPHLCCSREVREELGVPVAVGRLLVTDWVAPNEIRKAWFGYVFDGGALDDLAGVRLQGEELDAVDFVERGLVRERFTANTADRIEAALQARACGGVAYLHNGRVFEQASTLPTDSSLPIPGT